MRRTLYLFFSMLSMLTSSRSLYGPPHFKNAASVSPVSPALGVVAICETVAGHLRDSDAKWKDLIF